MKIVNFSILGDKEKEILEKNTSVVHYGASVGIKKDPTEAGMIEILSKEQPDVLIVNSAPTTSKVIDCTTNLKLIVCARGNPINVDVAYALSKGIPVTHTPGRNANAVAEYTIGMIIVALRKIIESTLSIKNKECTVDAPVDELKNHSKDVVWLHPDLAYEPYYQFMGNEIMGKTLGLVGFGFIGQCVAKKAIALGMNVIAYDLYLDNDFMKSYGVESVLMDDLLKTSDVISLHAKATDKPIITKQSFDLMKNTSLIINTARSSLIDVLALIEALENKKIGSAVLDVFDYEPLSNFDVLVNKNIETLILTPHIAGAAQEVSNHQSAMVLEAVLAYINGDVLPYQAK